MTRITTIVLIYLISSLTSQERGFNLKNIQKYSYVNNSYVFNLHYKINDINYSQFTFLPSIDTTFLRAGDYKIMILSKYLNDSLSSDSPIWFYPIFLDQKIILFYKNKIVYNECHKVNKINVVTTQKKTYRILENEILEIGIIKGNKDYFFCIEGYGGCSTCPEYNEIFDKQGKSLFLLYNDQFKTYKHKGILLNILKKNGIDEKAYRKGIFLKKKIDPFQKEKHMEY